MDRFKLLRFDLDGCLEEEDEAMSVRGARTSTKYTEAMLLYCPYDVTKVSPKPGMMQASADDPDIPPLFRSLDNVHAVLPTRLQPGEHLFALYGDNFWNRTKFTMSVSSCDASIQQDVQEIDAALLDKKAGLEVFKAEYLAAMAAFEAAKTKVKAEEETVKRMMDLRNQTYSSFTKTDPL
jgi:hypothetical protein